MTEVRTRIESRLKKDSESGCWLWTGATSADNPYGRIVVSGRTFRVHRAMWESEHGTIPPGMLVCHKCDTPACCNPDHLFLGTNEDNMRDALSKGRLEGSPVGRRGEENHAARLTSANVEEILKDGGNTTAKELAARYGVSAGAIDNIRTGRKWRHISSGHEGRLESP